VHENQGLFSLFADIECTLNVLSVTEPSMLIAFVHNTHLVSVCKVHSLYHAVTKFKCC
jgi:hypothetical protein